MGMLLEAYFGSHQSARFLVGFSQGIAVGLEPDGRISLADLCNASHGRGMSQGRKTRTDNAL